MCQLPFPAAVNVYGNVMACTVHGNVGSRSATVCATVFAVPLQYKPKKEYYGEEKHEEKHDDSYSKKEYYKQEKHDEYEVRQSMDDCDQWAHAAFKAQFQLLAP